MLSIHCKIALVFLFSSLAVRHFGNSQRRACALRGASGRLHLEPRWNDGMFVALGKEFYMIWNTILAISSGKFSDG